MVTMVAVPTTWEQTCSRKVRHTSYTAARAEADRLEWRTDRIMTAYQCAACELWHVAHADPKRAVIELLRYAIQKFSNVARP